MHHGLSIRFLVKGNAHHVNLAFESELVRCKTKGTAPLAGSSLGGEPRDTFTLVVVSLGHCTVGLMAPIRRDAFILIIDLGLGAQCLFQLGGSD